MKRSIKDLHDNEYIICTTEEEAKKIVKLFYNANIKWYNSRFTENNTNWGFWSDNQIAYTKKHNLLFHDSVESVKGRSNYYPSSDFLEEEFTLPEKWCIKNSKENYPIIVKWFRTTIGRDPWDRDKDCYWHFPELELGTCTGSRIEKGYTEITLKEFKKYVLNEQSEEMKTKKEPQTFTIEGKPHQLDSIMKDLVEIGFNISSRFEEFTKVNKNSKAIDFTKLCNEGISSSFNTSFKNKEEYLNLGFFDILYSKRNNFKLPEDYSKVLIFAKEQFDIYQEYIKPEEKLEVGDFVIDNNNNIGIISNITYNTTNVVSALMSNNTHSIHNNFKKITKEQFERKLQLPEVNNYSGTYITSEKVVKYGCATIPSVAFKLIYEAHNRMSNGIGNRTLVAFELSSHVVIDIKELNKIMFVINYFEK